MSVRATGLALIALFAVGAASAEVIPPPPAAHFNDYASLVSPATAASLETRLDQFERATSNQIVVAIYPKLESESSIEDYTVRVAQSSHVGLKGKDNGAVLFIFAQSIRVSPGRLRSGGPLPMHWRSGSSPMRLSRGSARATTTEKT